VCVCVCVTENHDKSLKLIEKHACFIAFISIWSIPRKQPKAASYKDQENNYI